MTISNKLMVDTTGRCYLYLAVKSQQCFSEHHRPTTKTYLSQIWTVLKLRNHGLHLLVSNFNHQSQVVDFFFQEKENNVIENHGLAASHMHPDRRWNWKPWYVPWLELAPTNWAAWPERVGENLLEMWIALILLTH